MQYMNEETALNIETTYRKKKIRIHLRFTTETSDENAQSFYTDLKKIYIEDKFGGMHPEISALKYD